MHKTERYAVSSNTMTVDTSKLAQMLCCGRDTAVKIGVAAGAKIKVDKRVLWYLPKIHNYLEQVGV